jgi:hypothetical protein
MKQEPESQTERDEEDYDLSIEEDDAEEELRRQEAREDEEEDDIHSDDMSAAGVITWLEQ